MKNIAKIDHINLTVGDYEKTKSFYEELFGFEAVEEGIREDNGKKWGILKLGESTIALSGKDANLKDATESEGIFHRINHFGLRIFDRRRWEEKIKKLKIKLYYNSPVEYPHSTSWYINDPNGHEIEVSIWKNNKMIF